MGASRPDTHCSVQLQTRPHLGSGGPQCVRRAQAHGSISPVSAEQLPGHACGQLPSRTPPTSARPSHSGMGQWPNPQGALHRSTAERLSPPAHRIVPWLRAGAQPHRTDLERLQEPYGQQSISQQAASSIHAAQQYTPRTSFSGQVAVVHPGIRSPIAAVVVFTLLMRNAINTISLPPGRLKLLPSQ